MLFVTYKYDVTFSFAEEDDAFVREVTGHLQGRDLNYYYYKEDEVSAWGKDLKKHLSGIYSQQSRLCVIFVSKTYQQKVWTKFEIDKAQLRAKKTIREYVLPFKLDDTELPEIPPSIKYLSIDQLDSRQLADAIYNKIIAHRAKDTFINRLGGEIKHFFSRRRNIVSTVIFTILSVLLGLQDQLTPVGMLAGRLHERSKKTTKGSICRDGLFSRSRGRGTCSSHQGVLRKKDSLMAAKTMEECYNEAKQISWLGE